MKLLSFETYLFSLLIAASALLMMLQEYALNTKRVFDPTTQVKTNVISDGDLLGGNSKVYLSQDENKFQLHCTIAPSDYAWPFCEFQLILFDTKNKYGIDLTQFTDVVLHVAYADRKKHPIRFQIRSYELGHSSLDNQNTWKYNGLEYQFSSENDPAVIPLSSLQVASWWLVEQKIPINKSMVNLSNAMMLEVATGNGIAYGNYQIDIYKIEFRGKLFKTRRVYLTIILLWIAAGVFTLAIHLVYSRRQLQETSEKALQLKRLNKLLNVETEKLKESSARDPLTGAFNRAGVQSIFTDQIPVLSIIFIDIDHFKAINDNYGHAIGDEVLVKLVKTISENSRQTDLLARWGGEEFLLICPNTPINEALLLAEELRLLFSEMFWPHQQQLTASFGVGQRKPCEDITEFIHRTDMALYKAKTQGRNKVVRSE